MRAEQALSNLLKEKQLTVSLVESVTCGLATHKLGSVSNTSDILKGSIIAYNEDIKVSVMNVSKNLIRKHTAESQQVTNELARQLFKIMNADVSIAITGLSAPGGSETKSKPVGTIFISIFFRKKMYRLKTHHRGSSLEIKIKACKDVFEFAKRVVRSQKPEVRS